MIKINPQLYTKVINSKKDFFLFNLNDNNQVTEYILTNDYNRNYKDFQAFRVVSTIKKNEVITIK